MTTPNSAAFDPMKLAELDKAYDSTEAITGELPDGKYFVVVEKLEMGASSAGDPMLKWTLRVLGPTQIGQRAFKNSVIGAKSIAFLKGEMQAVKFAGKVSDLVARYSELTGRVIRIRTYHDDAGRISVRIEGFVAMTEAEGIAMMKQSGMATGAVGGAASGGAPAGSAPPADGYAGAAAGAAPLLF